MRNMEIFCKSLDIITPDIIGYQKTSLHRIFEAGFETQTQQPSDFSGSQILLGSALKRKVESLRNIVIHV